MEEPPYEDLFESDIPPRYQPSISARGRLLCKQELLSPEIPALNRHWDRVECELRGTTLLLSEPPSGAGTGPLSSSAKRLRSYTLQAADVGLATDDKRHPGVFRLRVEGQQLLFIAPDVRAALAWVESLLMAIMISDPLESRKMPKYPLPPPRKKPVVGCRDPAEGFRRRLWSELAWRSRQKREWLLESPGRTFREIWEEVVHGRECAGSRRHSSSSASDLNESGSFPDLRSQCPCAQCPCAQCWRTAVPTDEVRGGEKGFLGKDIETYDLASDLERSIQCTRSLTRWAEWKDRYYIKGSRRFKIPPRTSLS